MPLTGYCLMSLPNFLLIGAAKAGTTSLYHYLGQHPEVYMSPVKEPNFLAFAPGETAHYRGPLDAERLSRPYTIDRAAYERLFDGVAGQRAVGEASHWYLYHPGAPARMRQIVPEARLLAVLRNPVDRAYSTYLHLRRTGQETLPTFTAALDAEAGRIADGWAWGHYTRRGFYHAQLQRVYAAFPAAQVHVMLYDDLQADPLKLMQDAYRFLGVDPTFVPDLSLRFQQSGIPKHPWVERLLSAPIPLKKTLRTVLPPRFYRLKQDLQKRNLVRPPLPPEVRRRLLACFRDDVLHLQDLLNRDLSAWLAEPSS